MEEILESEFEVELFKAATYNLNQKENKLRYNNFAYSIRELSRHFLYRLAPEENVKLCSWFKEETEDGKPSRTQRIKYAIQGGISDNMLNLLGFDSNNLNEEIRAIKKTIDSLSKYTHINPETFDIDSKDVDEMSAKVLGDFKIFAERISVCRSNLKNFLDGKIELQMIDAVISNYYENIDMLAPHHSVNYHDVSEYDVVTINDKYIEVEVFGNIHFTLEYGSKQERRDGDGLDLFESFPFKTKIYYEISSQSPFSKYFIEQFDVNTDEWYDEY